MNCGHTSAACAWRCAFEQPLTAPLSLIERIAQGIESGTTLSGMAPILLTGEEWRLIETALRAAKEVKHDGKNSSHMYRFPYAYPDCSLCRALAPIFDKEEVK